MFRFNLNKTIQAAAVLLEREPGQRMNYMRLLKLLYLADRQTLKDHGRPICGSPAFAMKRGPVLGTVLDLINGLDPEADRWAEFIRKDHYDVELEKTPGNLELSRYEIRKLHELSELHRDHDELDMVDICHGLPEFEKNDPEKLDPPEKQKPIPLDDVLEAIGRLKDKDAIIRDANESAAFARMFGDHTPTYMKR